MRILFVVRHHLYLRNYESTLKALAARNHAVYIASNIHDSRYINIIKTFENIPNIHFLPECAPIRSDVWSIFARFFRALQDYIHYFSPLFDDAPRLKQRACMWLPQWLANALYRLRNSSMVDQLKKVLRFCEKILPRCKAIDAFLITNSPDVLLITPYVDLKSQQVDYVKSARALGIPSVYCVASWDNLTSKAAIKVQPDKMFVWNTFQENEAIKLHNMPQSKIVVTGAQCYDQWFHWKPVDTQEKFYSKVGLKHDTPYILYLCSSIFIARNEVDFVRRWINALRRCGDSNIKNIGILIRPHPQNAEQWKKIKVTEWDNVALFPKEGEQPITSGLKEDYFNSMYFSSAVVGINTSAMIEAGILGKPVFTIQTNDFMETQEGTVHFRYLSNGGLLYSSTSIAEHVDQLSHVLLENQDYKTRIQQFIADFIRPRGLGYDCTPFVVDEIEAVYRENKTMENPRWRALYSCVRIACFPFAVVLLFVFAMKRLNKRDIQHII
ncbi:hypothetical protein KDK77_01785 [bacterium]|nr:hypothetical protein [bacterium]MCP5462052.1 hypothetical protein [bacterium]